MKQTEAAALLGISVRMVQRAARIKREAPDLFGQMRAGKLKAGAAEKILEERKKAANVEAAYLAEVVSEYRRQQRQHGHRAVERVKVLEEWAIEDAQNAQDAGDHPKKFLYFDRACLLSDVRILLEDSGDEKTGLPPDQRAAPNEKDE